MRVARAQEVPLGAAALRVERRAITVLDVDEESRTLAIFERVELRNDGAAAFEPSMGGEQGPMGLLRFGLPRNAYDLTLDPQMAAYDVIQVDRGFASLMPLPPGPTQVNFSYRVPYGGGAYELNAGAIYPTASLWVLVPANLETETPDLRLETTADIGRQRFKVLLADDLAPGPRINVALSGLPYTPRPWLLDESVQRVAAVVLALAGAALAWAYANRRGSVPARPPANPA